MDKKRARNWYWWLWLSPLLTLPTLAALFAADPGYEWICGGFYRACDWSAAEGVTALIAVLGSALWHLVLLIPALNKEHPFARWHGRQALLLAGVRTAVPLAFGLAFGGDEGVLLSVPVLIVIWLGGTLWGQRQAIRGDCSLMRWLGRAELLSALQRAEEQAEEEEDVAEEPDVEALVEILRFSRDPEKRRQALAELEKRRMVDSL